MTSKVFADKITGGMLSAGIRPPGIVSDVNTGSMLTPELLQSMNGYDGDGNLLSTIVTDGDNVWALTNSYSGGKLIGRSGWVKQEQATTMVLNAGDGQTAATGAAVAIPPSVLITDANGNPVSGTSVTFAVASGGGSVTGATATSNGSGIATVGSWTLGPSIGANTLTATHAGLSGSPVTFSATGIALSYWDATRIGSWTLSDAGATVTVSGAASWGAGFGADALPMNTYFEIKLTDAGGSMGAGVGNASAPTSNYAGSDANGWSLLDAGGSGRVFHNGVPTSVDVTPTNSSVMMVAWDGANLWLGADGAWISGGNPALGTTPTYTSVTGSLYAAASIYVAGGETLRVASSQLSYSIPSGFRTISGA